MQETAAAIRNVAKAGQNIFWQIPHPVSNQIDELGDKNSVSDPAQRLPHQLDEQARGDREAAALPGECHEIVTDLPKKN